MLPAGTARTAVYDRWALEQEQERGSWRSGEYVAEWADDDVLEELLQFPRELSAAIVTDSGAEVEHVLDLGSGTGPYLEVFLRAFPAARGTWVDSSRPMQTIAGDRLAQFGERVSYVAGDVADLGGLGLKPAQVVVTSRVLHDISPARLQDFYPAVSALVLPGGFFFNLDHFAAPAGWESRYRRIRERFTGRRKRRLAPHRDHPLGELDDHLRRLEAAGFEQPDVPWRTFFTALVAAQKPV